VAKFPDPPAAGALVARLSAELKALRAGTLVWRVYFRGGPHATGWSQFRHWGPVPIGRYDHHLEPPRDQVRGILYTATLIQTCLAEVFQDSRTIERSRQRPWLAGFELARGVSLLDMTGTWPTRAGASMAIHSGRRDRARAWSRRIYEDYPALDGLYYPSSMGGNEPIVALFERARTALPPRPVFNRALADPALNRAVVRAALAFNYLVEP
jgi:hypothetical protein